MEIQLGSETAGPYRAQSVFHKAGEGIPDCFDQAPFQVAEALEGVDDDFFLDIVCERVYSKVSPGKVLRQRRRKADR
jgi:hypothetical protein